jgi:gliding motility-associated-like protein
MNLRNIYRGIRLIGLILILGFHSQLFGQCNITPTGILQKTIFLDNNGQVLLDSSVVADKFSIPAGCGIKFFARDNATIPLSNNDTIFTCKESVTGRPPIFIYVYGYNYATKTISNSISIRVNVRDTIIPKFTNPSGKWSATLNCNQFDYPKSIYSGPMLEKVISNCPLRLYAAGVDTVNRLCENSFDVIQTLFAIDSSLNFSMTRMDTFRFRDVTGPVYSGTPGNLITPTGAQIQDFLTDFSSVQDFCTPFDKLVFERTDRTFVPGDMICIGGISSHTYKVTDLCGNSTNFTRTVTSLLVDDIDPIITCPDTIRTLTRANCEAGPLLNLKLYDSQNNPTYSDNCRLKRVDWIFTNDPQFNSFASTNNFNDDLSTYLFGDGIFEVKWIVSDFQSNPAECKTVVIVRDTFPPEFPGCPLVPVTSYVNKDSCKSRVIFPALLLKDNCNSITSFIQTAGPRENTSVGLGDYMVEFRAKDEYDNEGVCKFLYSVRDTLKPIFVLCPPTIRADTLPCPGIASWNIPVLIDHCSFPGIVTSNKNPGDYFPAGTTLVTYVGRDSSGNETTCSFNVISRGDLVFPAVQDCPKNLNTDVFLNNLNLLPQGIDSVKIANCDSLRVWWTEPKFSDNCTTPLVISNPSVNSGSIFGIGNRIINYTATDIAGNTTVCSFSISITADKRPFLESGNTVVCSGDSLVLTAKNIKSAIYNWSGPGGINRTTRTIKIPNPFAGIYTLNILAPGCKNTLDTSFTVQISLGPIANRDVFPTTPGQILSNFSVILNDQNIIGDAQYTVVRNPNFGTLFNNGDGTFNYTALTDFPGRDSFIYRICNANICNSCDTAVVVFEGALCTVPNVLTPNGDGYNESLYIYCLDVGNYRNSELTVFNQWGDKVFNQKPYQNNWQGTGIGNNPLPDGTYFYLFKLDNDSETKKGFITILRNN